MANNKSNQNLIYTFYSWNNLTYKIVRQIELDNTSKLYISGKNGPDRLTKQVLKNKYKYVLGLGDYRKDAKKIRIESKFQNKYGKSKIKENGFKYYMTNWKLPKHKQVYIAKNASRGPCNRSMYTLLHKLKQTCNSVKTAFLHVPSSFDKKEATHIVKSYFKDL